ncbi:MULTISPECIES: XRE family transcriptional regulator [unclassified Nocardioides]|uniref:XRE family transcriptional regulator n=1 Tax=unclassified Nocardioides TaxID=2615069 RepID=UPI0006F277D0|nr:MULTISPECIES: ImmA/IrrE family metallo-endopeptidase [unclassified Nocardioides]KRA31115.1 transcriptional regulator [Nocardioides sp. Root614]KRA87735.1 transcriptional regulator [Nocardioides sp. Root682]
MSNTDHDPLPIGQIPVGEILGRELDSRGWSQADFAVVLGRPTQFVSEIVTGKKEITRESAAQIGAALDHTAEYWLQLQDQYLLAEQQNNPVTKGKLDEVRRRALLNRKGPIQLLQKRKILTGKSLDDLEAEVMELFELDSLDDEPGFAAAAKRGNQGENISVLQRAWVACVRKEARQLAPESKYSAKGLRKLAAMLSTTLMTSEDFAKLPELFAEVGVRLVYVEMLPGGKIDGCAMYVDNYPVIGLSGRGKRFDKVLFTLLHEIAHILMNHVDADRMIVEDLDETHEGEAEREDGANTLAGEWLFPEGFPSVPVRISGPWVDQVAADLGVARIVVVGHLQHHKRLDWRTTLAKNAPAVDAALSGWK